MNWFEFKNAKSSNFKSLIVNELPSIIKPSEKVTRYEVANRHGEVIIPTGYYGTMIKTVECTVKDLSEIDGIISWLSGSGKVVFSNQPDRFYNAVIINQIPFERVIRKYRKFIVEFECQPFGYLLSGQDKIVITENNSTITNLGNIDSEPVIMISGEGDIELSIGLNTLKLKGVNSSITIDSCLMEVYKGIEVQNRKFKGEFPTLPIGEFSLSWVGNVNKIEIKPNWRTL